MIARESAGGGELLKKVQQTVRMRMADNFQRKPVPPHAQEHLINEDVAAVAFGFFGANAF